jgi:hypothetical protein
MRPLLFSRLDETKDILASGALQPMPHVPRGGMREHLQDRAMSRGSRGHQADGSEVGGLGLPGRFDGCD